MNIKQKMIEAMAERWAVMDGKGELFKSDKNGWLSEEAGYYDGYCAEARELLDAALAVLADPENWTPEMLQAALDVDLDYQAEFAAVINHVREQKG